MALHSDTIIRELSNVVVFCLGWNDLLSKAWTPIVPPSEGCGEDGDSEWLAVSSLILNNIIWGSISI